MADTRHKNKNWCIAGDRHTRDVNSWDQVHTALLMDLRDELQQLNRTLACPRFLAIPTKLEMIEKNTRPGYFKCCRGAKSRGHRRGCRHHK